MYLYVFRYRYLKVKVEGLGFGVLGGSGSGLRVYLHTAIWGPHKGLFLKGWLEKLKCQNQGPRESWRKNRTPSRENRHVDDGIRGCYPNTGESNRKQDENRGCMEVLSVSKKGGSGYPNSSN